VQALGLCDFVRLLGRLARGSGIYRRDALTDIGGGRDARGKYGELERAVADTEFSWKKPR